MTITTSRTRTISQGPSATPVSRWLRLGRLVTAVVVGVGALLGLAGPAAAAPEPIIEPGSPAVSGAVDSGMSWGIGALVLVIALAAILVATMALVRRAARTRHETRPVALGA